MKLRKTKETAYVYQFSGYIFFGASHHIVYKIDNKLLKLEEDPNYKKEVKYIVLDFSKISGLDTSSFIALAEWVQHSINKYKICLVFVTEKYRKRIKGLIASRITPEQLKDDFYMFHNLDSALVYIENTLLEVNNYIEKLKNDEEGNLTIEMKNISHVQKAKEKLRKIIHVCYSLDNALMRRTFLHCFMNNLGKFKRVEKGEILYKGFDETDGIYILIDGIISCYPSQFGELTALYQIKMNRKITNPVGSYEPPSPIRITTTPSPETDSNKSKKKKLFNRFTKTLSQEESSIPRISTTSDINPSPIIVRLDELEKEKLFVLCHPGSMFGCPPQRYGITMNFETTIADVRSLVYHISKDTILMMLENDPDMASALYSWDRLFSHRKQVFLAKRLKVANVAVY